MRSFIKKSLEENPVIVEVISLFLVVGVIYFGVKGAMILGFRTPSPMMGVSSGSMRHLDGSWKNYYEQENYNPSTFPFQGGLERGDLVFVKGVDSFNDIQIGDVIVWQKGDGKRIIHRVADINEEQRSFSTKGDANLESERGIRLKHVIGKAVFSVPYLGYPSLEV